MERLSAEEPARVRGGLFAAFRKKKVQRIPVQLFPAGRLRGRIMLGAGSPAARLPLLVTSAERNDNGDSNFHRIVRTDDDGRFEIDKLLPGELPTVLAVLSEAHLARLPAGWRDKMQPVVPLLFPDPAVGKTRDLGDVDLSTFCPLRIAVTTKEGDPADRPVLHLVSAERDRSYYVRTHAWGGDRSGMVHVLLPDSNQWMAWLENDDTVSCRGLIVQRAGDDLAFATLRWRLERPCWIEGTVTDHAGQPAPGASVCTMFLGGNATPPEPPRAPGRVDKNAATCWPELAADELRFLISRITERRIVHAGEGGTFRIVLPAEAGSFTLMAFRPPGHSMLQERSLGTDPIKNIGIKLSLR